MKIGGVCGCVLAYMLLVVVVVVVYATCTNMCPGKPNVGLCGLCETRTPLRVVNQKINTNRTPLRIIFINTH